MRFDISCADGTTFSILAGDGRDSLPSAAGAGPWTAVAVRMVRSSAHLVPVEWQPYCTDPCANYVFDFLYLPVGLIASFIEAHGGLSPHSDGLDGLPFDMSPPAEVGHVLCTSRVLHDGWESHNDAWATEVKAGGQTVREAWHSGSPWSYEDAVAKLAETEESAKRLRAIVEAVWPDRVPPKP